MKKALLLLTMTAMLSAIGSAMASTNIAVVDVQAVVAKSAQVAALKKEQKAKMQELDKWLKTAQEDVKKQSSDEAKQKLLKKYNSEFAKKKATIAKDYKTKLSAIDKNITETITTKSKAMGYDMVISKSMVITGGDDITAEIQKIVK